jgi:hypothetical protein
MKVKGTILFSMTLGAAAVLMTAHFALSQPPAGGPGAPGASGRGGRGGGRGAAQPFNYEDNEGWQKIFDGATMNGWAGNTKYWSVKDDSLYIHPSCEAPTGTTYIYWTNGEPGDFALKYELKGTEQVNGGMQFRSYRTASEDVAFKYAPRGRGGFGGARGGSGGRGPGGAGFAAAGGRGGSGRGGGRGPACANPGQPPSRAEMAPWDLNGPQADFDANNNFSGMFYEQGGRGIISGPGHALLAEPGKPVQDLGTIADKATLDSWFHKGDWNQYMIVARGHTTSIYMNGHLVTLFIDNDPAYFRASGKIGAEVESTGEYWVRNIYLQRF